jgi:hypothetical protein
MVGEVSLTGIGAPSLPPHATNVHSMRANIDAELRQDKDMVLRPSS